MKIKPDHYAHMRDAIQSCYSPETVKANRDHIAANRKPGLDLDKLLRWNLCYGSGLTGFICSEVYKYANDSHIDTALRQIMREVYSL